MIVGLNQTVRAERAVRKEFHAGSFTALKGAEVHVDQGEFVAIIGKSTLINMITGIDRPTTGEVFVANMPVHTLNEGAMAVLAW